MCRVLNILLAVLSRLLFALHGFVTVWYVTMIMCENIYWLLLMGVALLGVEMVITIKYTHNAAWKWFSPMIFLYLTTMIPSIWYLELKLSSHIISSCATNVKKSSEDEKNVVAFLERTMIIVLVLGRWLMPKGQMSRGQLSQLLLVYVALGTDIQNIFATFKEDDVKKNHTLIIVGLSLFSFSLMQFLLVLTKRNHPKCQRQIHLKPSSPYTSCYSEIWSLLSDGFQDGPFLGYRLYLMFSRTNWNVDMIFFTCKNILIVMLGLYRCCVVYFGRHKPGRRERGEG